jgi:hypothetical protein
MNIMKMFLYCLSQTSQVSNKVVLGQTTPAQDVQMEPVHTNDALTEDTQDEFADHVAGGAVATEV